MARLDADEQRIAMGRRLREVRRERGLSLAEIAELTGMSSSFLSLVETGRSDISLGRLMRLVESYGLTLAQLFPDEEESPELSISRAGEHLRVPSYGEGIEMVLLSSDARRSMTPFMAVYERGARMSEPTLHDGEAFVLVMEGRLRLTLEGADESVVLDAGDSAYLDTSAQRTYENVGDGTARLVGVLLRPADAAPPPARLVAH